MKTCSRCKQTLPKTEFTKAKSEPDGLYSYCKPCKSKHEAKFRTPERTRKYNIRSKFKIELSDYVSMLEAQNGVCAICKHGETLVKHGRVMPLCVDHDHITNKIRGLLCNTCNRALGLLKDNLTTVREAVAYLEKANT